MTKFKVGDRVTFSGVITRCQSAPGFDDLYRVEFSKGVIVDLTDNALQSLKDVKPDTTFRDQAAIAICASMISDGGAYTIDGIARAAFSFPEALDAERKKRDGGEG